MIQTEGIFYNKKGKALVDAVGTLLAAGQEVVVYREGHGLSPAVLIKYNDETDQVGLEIQAKVGRYKMQRFSTPYWVGKFYVR